jgi:GH25 family lysozyme M1 (1,4-beta-N-acetylmuramidase)
VDRTGLSWDIFPTCNPTAWVATFSALVAPTHPTLYLRSLLAGPVVALLLVDLSIVASTTTALAVDNTSQAHSPRIEQQLSNGPTSMPAGWAGADPGIDVSSAQHPGGAGIDWASVAGAGYSFAFVKATEGTSYVNPYYSGDVASAKSSGLYVAAYHFARPDISAGAAQADYLLNSAPYSADGHTFPPAVDVEYNPYGAECYGLSSSQLVAWIQSFSSEILSRVGYPPFIYTTADWWNTCAGSTAFTSNPLWVAAYSTTRPPLPPGWSTWTFWQYTSAGSVPGISGNVDLSYFNGSSTDLAVLAGSAPPAFGKAVFDAAGNLYVMTEGPDNSLYGTIRYASDGSWHGPFAIDGSRATYATPSPVFDAAGNLYVMTQGPANSLYGTIRYASDGSWHGPFAIDGPGTTYSAPSSVFGSGGNLFVMTRGANNSLYGTVRASNGSWSGPFTVAGPASAYAAPSSAFDSGGNLFVMTQGANSSLYGTVRASNGAWSGPFAIDGPGSVHAAPSSAFDSGGNLFVMTQGADNSLYGTVRASNGSWSGPFAIDGPASVYAAASSVFDSGGNLYVMTRGAHNSLYGTVRASNGRWSGPFIIAGAASVYAAPSSAFDSARNLYVMTEGAGNTLYGTIRYASNGSWHGPFTIDGAGTTY